MVKMSSIHVVLGLAARLNLEVEQLDVKTTCLQCDLKKKKSTCNNLKGLKSKEKKILCAS